MANRSLRLVRDIETQRTGTEPTALIEEIDAIADYDDFAERCETYGIYTNRKTLEVDLFEDGFAAAIITVLREYPFSAARKELINDWEADPKKLDPALLLKMIDTIGKGRFAQRMLSYIEGIEAPHYIKDAIKYVVERV